MTTVDPVVLQMPDWSDEPSAIVCATPEPGQPVDTFIAPDQDPHVTLAYLGPVPGMQFFMSSAQNDVYFLSTATGPFTAKVSGYGRLGDQNMAVLFLESEEIQGLHDQILEAPCLGQVIELNAADDQFPSFIPHLTLGDDTYPDERLTQAGEEVEWVAFDAIALWAGDSQTSFLLAGPGGPDDVEQGMLVDMSDDSINPISQIGHAFMEFKNQINKIFDSGVTAAGKAGFDPTLHPRGKDGKFIPKGGVIKWLLNGKWQYGKTTGINKNDHGGIDVTVQPSDLGGNPAPGKHSTVLKPNQIYAAPQQKAHLPLAAPGVQKLGGQKGSNTGGLYKIPAKPQDQKISNAEQMFGTNSPQHLEAIKKFGTPGEGAGEADKFYVKQAGSKEKGRNEELANTLYAMAGVYVPEVDYNPADNNIYSKIVPGQHDMAQQLDNQEWLDKVRRNFAVDAWLSNRDVFGLTYDNILTDEHGEPIRIDNGGALLYRAMGAKKTDFDGKVGELDVFRTGKKAKVFGAGMTQEQELDGAERVLAISPGEIEDAVAEAGLPKSLADTLKARRKYIADYYGLPLPESVKPMDSDQVATTAPVFDPGDIATSKGKDRNWLPSNLGQAQFILQPGDRVAFPDGTEAVYGTALDGSMLSMVGKQNQLYDWQQKHGPGADVMVKRSAGPAAKRPEHGSVVPTNKLTDVNWQRGDTVTAQDGTVYDVRGANSFTGGLLLQQRTGDGSPTTPFLIDTLDQNPVSDHYTVQRWDPPAPVQEPKPVPESEGAQGLEEVPITLPKQPEGMAEEAKTAIKADLEQPLPDPDTPGVIPPAKEKPADTGLGMVLGDGTEATPGDEVVSKNDGKTYLYKKKKGPYAIVTDPSAADPEAQKTVLASVLSQPGKTPTAVVEKPKTADGQTPAVGMFAEAKDGWAGEIVMISPDGKFVFIVNADGKKKRKSTGTVKITSAPEAAAVSTEPSAAAEKDVAAEVSTPDPAPKVDGPEGDFKKASAHDLKAGDQVSFDGEHWITVESVAWSGGVWLEPDSAEAAGLNYTNLTDADEPVLKKGPEPDVTQTSAVETTGAVDLHDDFMNIKPWSTWEHSPGLQLTTVDWATDGDKPAVVAMVNGDPNNLTLVYRDALPHDPVQLSDAGVPHPDDQPDQLKVNELYNTSHDHQPVHGNAALNMQAIKQGVDITQPNQFLTWDPQTETFWNNVPGESAKQWNPDTKTWDEPGTPTVAEAFEPVDTPHVPEGKGVFGLPKQPDPNLPKEVTDLLDSGAGDSVMYFKKTPGQQGSYWYVFDSKNPGKPVHQVKNFPDQDHDVTQLPQTGRQISAALSKQGAAAVTLDVTPEKAAEAPSAPLTMTPPEAPTEPVAPPAPTFDGYTPQPGDKIKKLTLPNKVMYFVQPEDDQHNFWYTIKNGEKTGAHTPNVSLNNAGQQDGWNLEDVYGPDVKTPAAETPTPTPEGGGVQYPDDMPPYTPTPGQKVVKFTAPSGMALWYAEGEDGLLHRINKNTGQLNDPKFANAEKDFDSLITDDGWKKETWPPSAPGAPDVNQPQSFGGYQAQPGDLVIEQPSNTPDGPPKYVVKPSGEQDWQTVNPDGTLGLKFDDEVMAWAIKNVNATQVFGDSFTPGAPDEPVTDITGQAVTSKPEFVDLQFLGGDKLNQAQALTWAEMPPLNPGDTLYAFQSTFNSNLWVQSNTGEVWLHTPYGAAPEKVYGLPGHVKPVSTVPGGQPKSALSTVPDLPGGYQLKPGETAVKVDYGAGSGDADWFVTQDGIDAYKLSESGKGGISFDLAQHKQVNEGYGATYTNYTAAGGAPEAPTAPEAPVPESLPSGFQAEPGQAVITFVDDDVTLHFVKTGDDQYQYIKANGSLVPSKSTLAYLKNLYSVTDADISTSYPGGGGPAAVSTAPAPSAAAKPDWVPDIPAEKSFPGQKILKDKDGDLWIQPNPGASGYLMKTSFDYHSAESMQGLHGVPEEKIAAEYSPVEVWPSEAPAAPTAPTTPAMQEPDWVPSVVEANTFPGQTFVKDKDGDAWVESPHGGYYLSDSEITSSPGYWDDHQFGGHDLSHLEEVYGPTEMWDSGIAAPEAPAAAAPVEAPSAPAPKVYPGSAPSTELEKNSWGGALTKDGYVPSVGMYVTGKGPMSGKVVQLSADKTKATVITSDGKKTQRLIAALAVDKGKNYQVYAAPPPVDLGPMPDGMPINTLPPKEAMAATAQDGKWRAILHGDTGAVSEGKMMVTKATTPSGQAVMRVHFVLSDSQRQKLLTHLSTEGAPENPANVPKGDWDMKAMQSADVAAGMKLAMRFSSTNKWVVDNKTSPAVPTHDVVSVGPPTGPDNKRLVTLKNIQTGETVTSSFHPGHPITNFVWDPNKPIVPKTPTGSTGIKISNSSKLNGWSVNGSNDHGIAGINGGTAGTIAVEPGKPVPSTVAAFRDKNGNAFDGGGIRQIRSDGVVIDVIHPNSGSSSVYGYTAITIPDGPDAEQKLQTAFAELQMPYQPMTQDGAKKAARGMLKNMFQFDSSANYKHANDPESGDAAMFQKVNQALGLNDVGWHDLLVGTMESNGKTEYIWSERVRTAMTAKMKLTTLVRGADTGTADAIASNLEGGGANTLHKMAGGLIAANQSKGRGISAAQDAKNGTTGSFTAANGQNDGPKFPGKNTHYSLKPGTGSGFLIFSNPLEAIGRLGDTRHSLSDNFGMGDGQGSDNFSKFFGRPYIGDMSVGGGIPSEGIAFMGVQDEATRQAAIKESHKRGIFQVNGRPVEEIILTRQKLTTMNIADHMPPMFVPANARPITELPTGYPAAGTTASMGEAA